jgi:hypothetical protein
VNEHDRERTPEILPLERERQIDLRRLPTWAQYAIALVIVTVVALAAWYVGKDQPVAGWITTFVIPALGLAYATLFLVAAGRWIVRRGHALRRAGGADEARPLSGRDTPY